MTSTQGVPNSPTQHGPQHPPGSPVVEEAKLSVNERILRRCYELYSNSDKGKSLLLHKFTSLLHYILYIYILTSCIFFVEEIVLTFINFSMFRFGQDCRVGWHFAVGPTQESDDSVDWQPLCWQELFHQLVH
jgi:hypothetical protein